jgi:hypothetical protein
MDGYTFPIRRLHLIRRTGKDAKGLVAMTVQESRFSRAEKTYREALCITVVRESRSAEFARLVPPEKQIPFVRTSSGTSVQPPASGAGPSARR